MIAIAAAVIPLLVAATSIEPLHVTLRQTLAIEHPGATAAYAVDPTVADAWARNGRVEIHGHHAGATLISVVTPRDVESYVVVVDAPPPRLAPWSASTAQKWTLWEELYDSGTDRLTSGLDVASRSDQQLLRLHLTNVTRLDSQEVGDARTSFPSATLEWRSGGRDLVLLDQLVEHSPLTIDGTSLRGVHYTDGALEIHAGATSPLLFRNVLLPADPETALGASYRFSSGGSTFTPNLYWFGGDTRYGGTRGPMGSLVYGYGAPEDNLRLRAEAGYGGEPGAALQLAYDGKSNRLQLDSRYEPRGFASLGLGRPHGTFADGVWSSALAPRLTLDVIGSLAENELPSFRERTASSTAEVRYGGSTGWSVRGGATLARFDAGTPGTTLRSITLPLGMAYDLPEAGISALYRYQRNTARNEGGSGGRVTARGTWARFQANAFVDYQRDAATLDLVFNEDPALARALAELGLTVNTPEDLARVLRDNPALAELGFVEGVTVNLRPWKLQTGGEIAWLPRDDAQQQLRARLIVDRTRAVPGTDQTLIATLSYSRRIVDRLEGLASITWWSRDAGASPAIHDWTYALGLRVRFDDVPRLPSVLRRGSVDGFVYRDDEARGSYGEGMPPVAGVRVLLDGTRAATTDARGRFSFDDAGSGAHRVEVLLAPEDGAYFTSRSSVTVSAGSDVSFGVAQSAARLSGLVSDDAGAAIAGVMLRLSGGEHESIASTDSSGHYAFAVAPGDYRLTLVADSVPAGHEVTTVVTRDVELRSATPIKSDLEIAAHRSVSGRLNVAHPETAMVRLVELGREVHVGHDGEYVFRALKPGRYTVEAEFGGRTARRVVEVSEGPSRVHGVDFP